MALRVYNIINIPNIATFYPVETPEEGAALIEKMGKAQLANPSIISNVFGLEEWDTDAGEWLEWYGPYGEDIDEFMEAQGYEEES